LPAVIPLLFLAALSFSAIGLYFTAILPSIDHMSLPFFLVIMPIGFASSTYFPLPEIPWLKALAQLNPLHHLSEGLRGLLLHGHVTWHLGAAFGLCVVLLVVLIPLDMRLLRKRVFGDG
jgi:ABC-type polysaccharide/polyol phosphate export permease